MKKIILIIFSFFTICFNAKALDTFYIGFKVDGIQYIKDKNGKEIYSEFRAIQKTGSDELSYCIQPGTLISDEAYTAYESYNDNFKISAETMEKIKLIARYGYLYNDHTDIKWYIVTQYLIWHEVIPDNWDIYFVDENRNRISSMYQDEINEIKSLVSNHHSKPNLSHEYTFNLDEDIVIFDDYNLLKFYKLSSGSINNNKIVINNNLSPGDYEFNLTLIDNTKPLFYNHPTGQDLFTRGEIFENNIKINIHITAGSVKIKECNEETFKDEFIGGTYEILDQDDAVVDEVTCKKGVECLSKILPIGYYKIRVKSLSGDYELNDSIYDVEVVDQSVSSSNVCSLKRRNVTINHYETITNNYVVNNNVTNVKNIILDINNNEKKAEDDSDTKDDILENSVDNKYLSSLNCNNVFDDTNQKQIDIPNTSSNTYIILFLFILSIITYSLSFKKYESTK